MLQQFEQLEANLADAAVGPQDRLSPKALDCPFFTELSNGGDEMKRKVSVLITDLDNTLYDWVEMWYRSFSAMLRVLVEQSGIPQETLEREIRQVFQEHGTSEYAFLVEELPSLQRQHPGQDIVQLYQPAIHAYRAARDEALRLYPAVLETLRAIKDQGSLIVAYTESMAFYTAYRMRHLGLDGPIDYLYLPPDHELPAGRDRQESNGLKATILRYTPTDASKPDPSILRKIIEDLGVTPDRVVYVGDSLMKDITMAHEVRIFSALANYGEAQHRQEYELLRRVTHWTDEDVAREREIMSRPSVEPTVRLHRSFVELLTKFEFIPVDESGVDNEQIGRSLEVWKTTVTVQQHFNDIEMRVRNFALTLLVAIIGASGLAIQNRTAVSIFSFKTSLAVWLLIGGTIAWLAFYFVDQIWYHPLLIGAVAQGTELEKLLERDVPGIGLTGAISRASPYEFLGRFVLRSRHKMTVFYFGIALMLVAFAIAAHFNAASKPASGSTTTSTASTLPPK